MADLIDDLEKQFPGIKGASLTRAARCAASTSINERTSVSSGLKTALKVGDQVCRPGDSRVSRREPTELT